MALRGVQLITAMSLVAELGAISRFDAPRQVMVSLGLVPSEHSSGGISKSRRDHENGRRSSAARALEAVTEQEPGPFDGQKLTALRQEARPRARRSSPRDRLRAASPPRTTKVSLTATSR